MGWGLSDSFLEPWSGIGTITLCMARDVKLLREQGYDLIKAEAAGLFPGTHHVERVYLLAKLQAKQPPCPPEKEMAIKEALKRFGMI